MDVQADAALEVMAETASLAEPTAGPSSHVSASSSSSPSSLSLSPSPTRSKQQGGPASLPVAVGASAAPSTQQKSSAGQPSPTCGYPKEIAVKPVEDKFLCGYCENILRGPLQSECGHRFCGCCRVKMTQLPQPVICQACIKEEMPEDSSILELGAMFDDKAAIREMRRIPCKCINQGCSWTGSFQDYVSNHETGCDKKMLVCSLCRSSMPQNKLANHEKTQCPKRQVSCQHCHQQMTHEQEMKHHVTCPLLPVKCDRCSTSVPRNEFLNHQERDCIHREMVCPVPGCHKKMSKEAFPSHLTDAPPKLAQKHLLYLFDKISQLEQELTRVRPQGTQPPAVLTLPSNDVSSTIPADRAVAASGEDRGHPESEMEVERTSEAVGGAGSASSGESQASATLKLHEDLMSVLHGEILRCIRQVEALSAGRTRETRDLRDIQTKIQTLERTVGTVEVRLQELQPPGQPASPERAGSVGTLVESSNGTATWSIPAFSQVRRAAVNGSKPSIDSPTFTTGSLGYKLRLRLFPDGDGEAKGRAMSVYVQLLPGPSDDLLPWPFQADIHFVLVDQRDFTHHKTASIHSPTTEQSCRKPARDSTAQQRQTQPGVGVQAFVSLQEIGNELLRYSVGDVLYLRAIVDTQNSLLQARLKSLDPRQGSSTSFRRPDRPHIK